MAIPKRKLGKTGVDVTIIGLGGEGILRTFGHEHEAYRLINRAVDLGINYCESARAYAGSESYYGQALRERRKEVFLTSKSHARDEEGAFVHLEETLRNMNTDWIDLWQVHDVRTTEDIEQIFGPRGALEAFVKAKTQGMVRFLGVTGHHDPAVLARCIEIFDFDTVLLPVNPAEANYKSFLEGVVPLAKSKDMGVVAMKVYLRGFAARIPGSQSLEPFQRYALSMPVSTAVIGCDTEQQLEENVSFARDFQPMSQEEIRSITEWVKPYARSLMYYKP